MIEWYLRPDPVLGRALPPEQCDIKSQPFWMGRAMWSEAEYLFVTCPSCEMARLKTETERLSNEATCDWCGATMWPGRFPKYRTERERANARHTQMLEDARSLITA